MLSERELLEAVVSAATKLLAERIITPSPSAEAAWTTLARSVENLARWQLHGNEISSVPARVRPCESCGAEMFFARLPTGRWLPLETDLLDAKEVLPAWRYLVDFNITTVGAPFAADGEGRGPTVTVDAQMVNGKVYVDHRQTCGMKAGPKFHVAAYIRRWRVNSERMDAMTSNVLAELQREINLLEDD